MQVNYFPVRIESTGLRWNAPIRLRTGIDECQFTYISPVLV